MEEQFGNKTRSVLKGQDNDIPMDKWKLTRVGKVIRRSVFITFPVDKEYFYILERKGFQLIY